MLHNGTCLEPKRGYGYPFTRDACGPCLREALLAHGFPGHTQDWAKEPDVERRAAGVTTPTPTPSSQGPGVVAPLSPSG